MLRLLGASFIWAFSFGLIKGSLGNMDSNLTSAIRLGISFLIFAPFIKKENFSFKLSAELALIGLAQFGVMYTAYIYSYQFLQSYQVALFTIFTPIYIVIINDIKTKKIHLKALISGVLAVAGAFFIIYQTQNPYMAIYGFLIVQISNVAFAFGQLQFKRLILSKNLKTEFQYFAFLYLGGALFSLAAFLLFTDSYSVSVSANEWLALLYLGIMASGVGFYLWNSGAVRVKTATLAVFNNIKIPLAILVSLTFFSEKVDLFSLLAGSLIIGFALFFAERN
jgi:drug/metabolite transporter (DMT)-like permease